MEYNAGNMGRISAEMIAAKLPKVGAETRSSFLLSKYIDLFEEHKPLRKGTPSTEATVELNKFIIKTGIPRV